MDARASAPEPRLVDRRNRVALTRDAMRALGVRPGDYVAFLVDDHGGVRLFRLSISPEGPRKGGHP